MHYYYFFLTFCGERLFVFSTPSDYMRWNVLTMNKFQIYLWFTKTYVLNLAVFLKISLTVSNVQSNDVLGKKNLTKFFYSFTTKI